MWAAAAGSGAVRGAVAHIDRSDHAMVSLSARSLGAHCRQQSTATGGTVEVAGGELTSRKWLVGPKIKERKIAIFTGGVRRQGSGTGSTLRVAGVWN